MKTPQELFNTIVTHLRTQNDKAVDVTHFEASCCYRTPGGKMCAVGCLIPAEKYNIDLEGASVQSLGKAGRSNNSKLLGDVLYSEGIDMNDDATVALLQSMQRVHDDYQIEEWESAFSMTAIVHNLTLLPKS